jgi:Chlorophyll A-B binding protein.
MKTSIAFLATVASLAGGASAFAPASRTLRTTSSSWSMSSSEETESSSSSTTEEIVPETPITPPPPAVTPINGWVPDASLPCYGLPGAIAPLGFFDPLGFTNNRELVGVKRIREAEVMHGRVSMMAVIGYLIGENTPTIAYGFDHPTIANHQIPEVPGTVLFPFFLAINIAEAFRAAKGWVEPGLGPLFTLRENYYPGDLGFDPLGLKPKNAKDFANMQEKELSNGRLAMIAAAGFCVQEQVNGMPILANLGF